MGSVASFTNLGILLTSNGLQALVTGADAGSSALSGAGSGVGSLLISQSAGALTVIGGLSSTPVALS